MPSKTAGCILLSLAVTAIGYAPLAHSLQSNNYQPSIPVSMIVSVEAKHGKEVPTINKEDVLVFQDHDRLPVIDWIPCQAEQVGIELFLLIDDSSSTELGLQLEDLSKFIAGQPATTAIGVGYIRNGLVEVRQNLTKDHSLAAKALRLPLGSPGAAASPYTAIADLVHRWPQSPSCRHIFLVSSGIDGLQPGLNNSYLDEAIERAEKAGIQVYSIYASRAGHFGHTFWRFNIGQNNLSRLTDETGGEAYFQALQMPISYGPYLNDFSDRLKNQFRLTFKIKLERKPGFQKIRLETEVPNTELVAADKVYVAVGK